MKTGIMLISLVVNAWLAYRVLDLGVTTTYQSDQIRYLNSQMTDVEKFWTTQVGKMSISDLMEAAKRGGLEVIEKKMKTHFTWGESNLYCRVIGW